MNNYFKIIILTALIGMRMDLSAQCKTHKADPQLTGVSFNKSIVGEMDDAILQVGWAMGGGDPTAIVPAGSWLIQISLPVSGSYIAEGIQDIMEASGFEWTYDADSRTLNGLSSIAHKWLDSGIIKLRVRGTYSEKEVTLGTQVNLFVVSKVFGGCPESFQNQISNDYLSAKLKLRRAAPIVLSEIHAENVSCGKVKLSWNTVAERRSNKLIVQRSEDGKKYIAVSTLTSGNSQGAEYSYTDQDVLGGRSYSYRILNEDSDGLQELVKEFAVDVEKCDKAIMDMYPNPANESIYVRIYGIENKETVSLQINNAIGERVRLIEKFPVNAAHQEIRLYGITPGVYTLLVTDNEKVTPKKFIKIDN